MLVEIFEELVWFFYTLKELYLGTVKSPHLHAQIIMAIVPTIFFLSFIFVIGNKIFKNRKERRLRK